MQNEKPMPEKKTGHKRGERRRRRSYSRWKRKRRWWWWCGGGGERGRGGKENVVRVCVCVCRTRLCNPFRESAERGTQTPEWGKNSVSSPLPSTLFLCLQRSGFPALPYTPVSHGSRLRGNQAKHKLGRRIVAGNIYKP